LGLLTNSYYIDWDILHKVDLVEGKNSFREYLQEQNHKLVTFFFFGLGYSFFDVLKEFVEKDTHLLFLFIGDFEA
jgi:hypothetical protein